MQWGPAQLLVTTHKQPAFKKQQLVKGLRPQWKGGREVESQVGGRSWPSLRGPPAHPALGRWVS